MPLNSLFFVLIILFSFPSLVFADSAIDDISLNNNGIEPTQLASYEEVDGTLAITIRNSENSLVGYIETTKIKVLDNAIAEKEIGQWTKKIISRNGQDFQTFQFEQKLVYEADQFDSSFRLYLLEEQADAIKGSHYGYIIEKGDTVSIVLTIFKPIENLQIDQAEPGKVFATQIISDCYNDFDCIVSDLSEIQDTTNDEIALSTFKELVTQFDQNSMDCHKTAHQMGMFLYQFVEKDLSTAFEIAGQDCGGAIYHGALMNFFLIERNNGVNPDEIEILNICPEFEENPYELERWQCLHGIGHGLSAAYDHDIFSAIKRCDVFEPGWEQISCNKGIFMENIGQELKTGEGSFDENDILFPCNQVELKYAPACYHYHITHILNLSENSARTTFEECDKIEPQELIKYCYHGLGKESLPVTLGNIELSNLLCQLGQPEFHKDCYRGMVMTMLNNDRDPVEGFWFCKVIPDTFKEDCYDGLGKWLIMLHPSDKDREKACSQIESERYFETCMNATLENIRLL